MPQIGRHADFSNAHAMAVEDIIVDLAAREQFRQDVPELLAYAQQADRTALWTSVVMFSHDIPRSGPS